jgi:hypothetical protein
MLGSSVVVFFADLIALGWLSMWRGMKARHSYVATLWSLTQVLAVPWVIFYIALTAGMMLIFMPRVFKGGATAVTRKWDEWLPLIFTALWFLISMAVAILTAWWARRCLLRYFRYQATASYQPAKPFFPRLAKTGTLPPRLA